MIGALVPVAPYIFLTNQTALIVSMLLSALALFGVGVVISTFTGRSWLFSNVRMLLIGALAAAITYAVGRVVGISTGL